MKFVRLCLLAFVLTLVAVVGTPASAAPFVIRDTGVDSNGDPIAIGAVDDNYTGTFSATEAGVQTGFVVRASNDGIHVSNNDTGPGGHMWVNPNSGDGVTSPFAAGFYRYTTTFDLTGFDHTTATINGSIASDDNVRIFLNGVQVVGTLGGSILQSFTIPSTANFIAGSNSLTFLVRNLAAGSHTGLLVANIQGDAVAVPELGKTGLLTALGLLGLLGLLVRDRQAIPIRI